MNGGGFQFKIMFLVLNEIHVFLISFSAKILIHELYKQRKNCEFRHNYHDSNSLVPVSY